MKTIHGWAYPDVDDFMWREMKADGSYQAGNLTRALAHVTDWSIACDGGAHVGTWTKPLSARFARVIAVEPSPDTFEALAANMQAFGCRNVEIHQVALGATVGRVSIAPLDARPAAMQNTGARYVREGGTIPRVRIDDWHLPTLGFLKLDIEGSEVFALEGARATLTRCRPIVLFENKGFWYWHYQLPKNAPHVLLTSLGYRFLEQAGKDEIWGPPS